MKIIMPLFEFSRSDTEPFSFSYSGLSLEQFEENDVIPLPGLSEMDIQYIKLEQWALIYQVEDKDYTDDYKEFVQLLLIAFHIFSDHHPPFIKYRICKENTGKSSRISATMSHNYETRKLRNPFDHSQLVDIDGGFKHLQEMCRTSARTKNALYFLTRAYSCEKWSESFVMMMIVLEALFSNDTKGAAKEPICQRTSSLLASRERCAKQDIEKLYDLRCDIVHGRIEFDSKESNNLQELAHLEFIVTQCFRELITQEHYTKFAQTDDRANFIKELDRGK